MNDPKHERHAEFTEWMGDNFDPNIIETDWLAEEVAELAKQWSRRPPVKRKRVT